MATALACPACANSVPVTADMAGKRARCPECRQSLALPSTLVELPDHPSRPPSHEPVAEPGWSWLWLAGIGVAGLFAVVLCAGLAGLVGYRMWRGNDAESRELAAKAVVGVPGEKLPEGAPPRAMRVTNFEGVFQVRRSQINQTDVVFRNQGGGVNNNKRAKEYVIDLEAGKTYVIDLESNDFDAFLSLEQVNGLVIQQDDDSGGGLNSRIRFTPVQTGSYVVVATSLGGGFGTFTLTVREAQFSRPR
jgi:hypothetical protein